MGGNVWRTTGDIRDTWDCMDKIGFSQVAISSYTRPGHWNYPDMLEIGNGGMNADERLPPQQEHHPQCQGSLIFCTR
ncbi:Alpha-galactosidase [Granulicella sibirica]|uniref:Alpha-galactosidase n=1 Tax=Granulicella sibirica TaxID=2479048 RepID=A0A4Q0STE2_9BACT|nr:Alpha-galactosidase [Granulicella sibirica]